jgi:hypothetical protein
MKYDVCKYHFDVFVNNLLHNHDGRDFIFDDLIYEKTFDYDSYCREYMYCYSIKDKSYFEFEMYYGLTDSVDRKKELLKKFIDIVRNRAISLYECCKEICNDNHIRNKQVLKREIYKRCEEYRENDRYRIEHTNFVKAA